MIERIKLVKPTRKYLDSYLECCKEAWDSDMNNNGFRDPKYSNIWASSIDEDYEAYAKGEGLPPGFVPFQCLWLLVNEKVIAEGSIRLKLTSSLQRYGANIGYCIRPSFHGKGYGTKLLALLKLEAKIYGLKEALITCDDTNIASAKIIEKNGGRHIDVIPNCIDGKKIRTKRYIVNLID